MSEKFVLLQVPAEIGDHTVEVPLESLSVWEDLGYTQVENEDYEPDLEMDGPQQAFVDLVNNEPPPPVDDSAPAPAPYVYPAVVYAVADVEPLTLTPEDGDDVDTPEEAAAEGEPEVVEDDASDPDSPTT